MKQIILSILIVFALSNFSSAAQDNVSGAKTKANEAIKLMDQGRFEDAITLLNQAQELDPTEIAYPYEKAYAYYATEKYDKAIEVLEKLIILDNAPDMAFQLLGDAYDMTGKSAKALEIYDLGLVKYPASGLLYLEKGNLCMSAKQYDQALGHYEKGIEVDPKFPSNYYRAAILYSGSSERVWAVIYGEIFLNLEKNTKRTEEISKLLFDTYKEAITFPNDSSVSISFSKGGNISVEELKDTAKYKMPFGIGAYEPCMFFSVEFRSTINLSTLNQIRTGFLNEYFKKGFNVSYPNVLFEYQKRVESAGHLEAYNYWLLLKGDKDGFTKWVTANKDKWNSFKDWFSKNPLKLNFMNKFFRTQYDTKK